MCCVITDSAFCITGAVRAAEAVDVFSAPTVPAHHPSQYIPRPSLRIISSSVELDTDDVDLVDDVDFDSEGEKVWTELERMLAAREAARALHPAGGSHSFSQ
jgi:hypothetical protein